MIPERALKYIQDKKLATSFSYKDVWNEEHSSAFTVAKCMQIDVLKDMKDAVESAIEKGETFETFKKNLLPTLEAKGWSGKKNIVDPLTGESKEVYINTPHRLKTIYNTNLRSAYQKGRLESAMQSEAHEYLMYKTWSRENTA